MRPPAHQERIDARVAFPDPLAVHELRHQRLEGDARLEARERCAQTEVRAEAEREVAARCRASTSKRSGSGNARSSRLAEPSSAATMAPRGMRVPASSVSRADRAEDHLDRRVVAQRLFHQRGHALGLAGHAFEDVRMLEQGERPRCRSGSSWSRSRRRAAARRTAPCRSRRARRRARDRRGRSRDRRPAGGASRARSRAGTGRARRRPAAGQRRASLRLAAPDIMETRALLQRLKSARRPASTPSISAMIVTGSGMARSSITSNGSPRRELRELRPHDRAHARLPARDAARREAAIHDAAERLVARSVDADQRLALAHLQRVDPRLDHEAEQPEQEAQAHRSRGPRRRGRWSWRPTRRDPRASARSRRPRGARRRTSAPRARSARGPRRAGGDRWDRGRPGSGARGARTRCSSGSPPRFVSSGGRRDLRALASVLCMNVFQAQLMKYATIAARWRALRL